VYVGTICPKVPDGKLSLSESVHHVRMSVSCFIQFKNLNSRPAIEGG
jgi:hypothetical protein